jgi:nitrous oxide reductase accessory protein NosL
MSRFMPIIRTLQLTLFLLVASTCYAAGIAATGPSPKDKCPVCGMFVAKYPDWTAAVSFKDAQSSYFDGPKDLFTFYLNIKKYRSSGTDAISSMSVKDYYTLKQIDARLAWYVIGGDVYGPMGKELIPFATDSDAKTFLKDHKGSRILRFNDINQAVLKSLQ